MEYTIWDGEKTVGTLRCTTEGLLTVFEAKMRQVEGLCRLWLIGEDKSAYLGIAAPCDGGLYLKKKFTRRAMAELPRRILCASTSAEPKRPEQTKTAEKYAEPRREEWTVLRRGSMNTLTVIQNGICYTAIPAKLRKSTRGVRPETIGGESYLLFRLR